jgi:hypothetical protein
MRTAKFISAVSDAQAGAISGLDRSDSQADGAGPIPVTRSIVSGTPWVGRMRWSTCQVRPAAWSGHLEDEVCTREDVADVEE